MWGFSRHLPALILWFNAFQSETILWMSSILILLRLIWPSTYCILVNFSPPLEKKLYSVVAGKSVLQMSIMSNWFMIFSYILTDLPSPDSINCWKRCNLKLYVLICLFLFLLFSFCFLYSDTLLLAAYS